MSDWSGKGKSVLVTGGARRIGRAIAETLAAQGWRVVVHARLADDADGRTLAATLGGVFVSGDLDAPNAAERLFREACRQAPDLCAVVNNASVFSVAATLPPAAADTLRRVNVEAPQHLTELLYAHLRGQTPAPGDRPSRCGSVVDLLDARILRTAPVVSDGLGGPPGGRPLPLVSGSADTPYAAAKRALADSLVPRARQFAEVLRVNAVAPGPVLKPTASANREPGGATLLPARPTPSDVAAAVAYLLSASAVTGQILAVDAGQSLIEAALQ